MAIKVSSVTPLVKLPPSEPKEPPKKAKKQAPAPKMEVRNGVLQRVPEDNLTPYQEYVKRSEAMQGTKRVDLTKSGIDKSRLAESFVPDYGFQASVAKGIHGKVKESLAGQTLAQKIPGLRSDPLFKDVPEGAGEELGAAIASMIGFVSPEEASNPLTSMFIAGPEVRGIGQGLSATKAYLGSPSVKGVATRALAPAGGAGPYTAADNIIGLPSIQPGLSKGDEIMNVVRGVLRQPKDNDIATPAMKVRNLARQQGESVANAFGTQAEARVRETFKLNKTGGIATLDGIDAGVKGAPTIADVAARLPKYLPSLTPEQKTFMTWLKTNMDEWKKLMEAQGIEVRTRADIMDGGFYLPRGSADPDDFDEPVRVIARSRSGGKKGFERVATFDSQAEGIAEGYKYGGFGETLTRFGKDATNRSTDAFIANYFKALGGGETQATRMLQQNPQLAKEMDGLKADVSRISALISKYGGKEGELIQRTLRSVADDPNIGKTDAEMFDALQGQLEKDASLLGDAVRSRSLPDDLDTLRGDLLDVMVKKGKSMGSFPEDLQKEIDTVYKKIDALQPKYQTALKQAQSPSRGTAAIDLTDLQGTAFPLEVANAANKALKAEKASEGVVSAYNNVFRAVRATLDVSAAGIQGLLGAADSPTNYGRAMNTMYASLIDDVALGKMIKGFDDAAKTANLPTSMEWGKNGLRIGGEATEFSVGIGGKVSNLPVIKQANRAFGNFGDSLRLRWAQDMLDDEMRTGRSLQEVIASGDMKRIAEITNNMTGWSGSKTGGSVGDLLLFAPRFFQSRLETVTKAGLGNLPGATLDKRAARRSMSKMVGEGVLLTVAVNNLLGEETDFHPFVDGRWNPNFMRIRYAGRDWSIFGPWDGLARAITSGATGTTKVATGDFKGGFGEAGGAVRGLGSGLVSSAWDLMIDKKDFVGNDIYADKLAFGAYLLRQHTPISSGDLLKTGAAVGGAVKEGEVKEAIGGAVTLVGEVSGVKSTELSYSDIRDIAAQEKFGKRFADLNKGERDQVNDDPLVKERSAEFKEDAGSPQQQTTRTFQLWEQDSKRNDEVLLAKLQADVKGKLLRNAIKEYKDDRFKAGRALFDEVVADETTRENVPIEDVLADRYWSVEAKEDIATDTLDFDGQELERERILQEADSLNIPRTYITGRGEGTFRGKRSENKDIDGALLEYELAQATIKQAGYFDAYKQIEGFKQYPQMLQVYREWVIANKNGTRAGFEARHHKDDVASVKAIDKQVDAIKKQLRRDVPGLELALVKYGYITAMKGITNRDAQDEWARINGITIED